MGHVDAERAAPTVARCHESGRAVRVQGGDPARRGHRPHGRLVPVAARRIVTLKAWLAGHQAQLGTAAIALTVLAMALPIQKIDTGCAQNSTYALVRAFAAGTAVIDPYEKETCDKSYRGGHFYSNKAPGLAMAILPAYEVVDGLGLLPESKRTALWIFGLWSSVLPAAIMLLLARRIANRFDPGTGTLVAVALGLATLTLPLATVDFGHVLAATLLLGAFAIALEQRGDEGRLLWLVLAGGLAGFAVTTEYPAALIALAVGIYAAIATRPVRRLVAFGAGGLVGVLPLLLYNQWAFGSATSLSYGAAVSDEGSHGDITVGHHDDGFYGVLTPSLSAAVRILLADRGLLTVTPIMILCTVGVVLLVRRGLRAEAFAIGGRRRRDADLQRVADDLTRLGLRRRHARAAVLLSGRSIRDLAPRARVPEGAVHRGRSRRRVARPHDDCHRHAATRRLRRDEGVVAPDPGR